jgi:hypothetical protein
LSVNKTSLCILNCTVIDTHTKICKITQCLSHFMFVFITIEVVKKYVTIIISCTHPSSYFSRGNFPVVVISYVRRKQNVF